MARRRENPEPVTMLVLLAALAGGAYWAWTASRPKPKKKNKSSLPGTSGPRPKPQPAPEPPPGDLPPQMGDADVQNLSTLGYPLASESVFHFQQDFNLVNSYRIAVQASPILNMTLNEDGVFGPMTRQALQATADMYGTSWPQEVAAARSIA